MLCVSVTRFYSSCLQREVLQSNMEWKYLTTHTSLYKTGYEHQTNNVKPLPIIPKCNSLLHLSFTSSGIEKSSANNVLFYETHYLSKCHVITLDVHNHRS